MYFGEHCPKTCLQYFEYANKKSNKMNWIDKIKVLTQNVTKYSHSRLFLFSLNISIVQGINLMLYQELESSNHGFCHHGIWRKFISTASCIQAHCDKHPPTATQLAQPLQQYQTPIYFNLQNVYKEKKSLVEATNCTNSKEPSSASLFGESIYSTKVLHWIG